MMMKLHMGLLDIWTLQNASIIPKVQCQEYLSFGLITSTLSLAFKKIWPTHEIICQNVLVDGFHFTA